MARTLQLDESYRALLNIEHITGLSSPTPSNPFHPIMAIPVCSNQSCQNPGTLTCARCKNARYCGPVCQRSQWSAHKATCKATATANTSNNSAPKRADEKSNCYILRAEPQTAGTDNDDNNNYSTTLLRHLEPSHLSHLGDEAKEKRQLEKHLGWAHATEVGKFYDHDSGSDEWYYYIYGDSRAFIQPTSNSNKSQQQSASTRTPPLPLNEAASWVCEQKTTKTKKKEKNKIYGDIAIIRSGPMGSSYAETFTKRSVADAVAFYRTNENDVSTVFAQREMSRAKRKYGLVGDFMMPMHVHMD